MHASRLTIWFRFLPLVLFGLVIGGLGSCSGQSSAETTAPPPPDVAHLGAAPTETHAPAPQPDTPAPTDTRAPAPQPEAPTDTHAPAPQPDPPTPTDAPPQVSVTAPVQQTTDTPAAETPYLLALPTIATAAAQNTGWHQLGGNPQRTHFVGAGLPAPTGPMSARNQDWRVLWIWNGPTGSGGPAANHRSLPDSVAPVAGDGRIYVGDETGTVRALDAATGTELWSRDLGGRILNAGAYDAATQAVYFASENGRLARLRAADGAIAGEFAAGSAIEGAVLIVGDHVFVGTAAGRLIAVAMATMTQTWSYDAGAAIYGSTAFAAGSGGLIIFPAEDGSVHAVRITNGERAWRTPINAYPRPERPTRPVRRFPDTYPVVAEQAGVVIVRSYFSWDLTWLPNGGAPVNQADTRRYIADRPEYESLFVLELATGERRFVAPVMGGAMGNGSYYYSSPPQAVIRRLPDGSDVAYLLWRNRTSCIIGSCDGREDTTFGEMDLTTGTIRFVQDYKNEGTIRFPTDEQGALTMVGDVLFHSHWMSLGAIRIPDRTVGGASYSAPIPSQEYLSVTNTMAANQCPQRNAGARFCPTAHSPPGDTYQLDPGFYIYAHDRNVYDQYWHPPVRGPIFDNGVLYWRSSDGAIIALAPVGAVQTPPPPSGSAVPGPATPAPSPGATGTPLPSASATQNPLPTTTATLNPLPTTYPVYLPVIRTL
jgi:hypothetical protein